MILAGFAIFCGVRGMGFGAKSIFVCGKTFDESVLDNIVCLFQTQYPPFGLDIDLSFVLKFEEIVPSNNLPGDDGWD